MPGAVPGVALEQPRSRLEQERHQRAVGLGHIQCPLHGASGGGRVAECLPGDRLQHEGLSQPEPPGNGSGALEDRRQRSGRRARVILGEPQRRRGDADLPAFAVLLVEAGENPLGTLQLAEAYQGVQHAAPTSG